MIKNFFGFALFIASIVVLYSCTKLNEQILDESSPQGLTEKQIAEGTIAPVYASLPSIFEHTRYFALQEISTDEAILPFRGGTDWNDNGIYIALHQHLTPSTDANIENTWNLLTSSISRSVLAINALATNTDPSAPLFTAEARGMRAYFSMLMLDLYGLIFKKELPSDQSEVLRGEEAVEYIKSELLAVEPVLETGSGPGRLSKPAVWGLLARLHLNAAVYRDRYAPTFTFTPEDMDKVAEYCDKIINSNQFALSADYFAIFNDNNHTNKELIFAVDQRADLNGHNRMGYFSLSGDQFPLPAYTGANGTDGPAITPEYYQTWVTAYAPLDPAVADPRFYKENLSIYSNPGDSCVDAGNFHINRGILRGQQYGLTKDANGAFVKCPDGKMKVSKLYNVTRKRPDLPVNFTEFIDYSVPGRDYSTGYRVEKYEFSRGSVSGRNFGEHDIMIIRLADVYLMRAEAKLRKGGGEGAALTDVNTIRAARTSRFTAPALATMNLDLLFRERGFELYWEHLRRTDMIRFGKYEGTWTEKTNNNPQKRIFPIPQKTIDASSGIAGFLAQNPSY